MILHCIIVDAEWLTGYRYPENSYVFEDFREDIKRLLRKTTIPEMHLSIVSMEQVKCVTKEDMMKQKVSIGDTLENFISGSYSKYCSVYQNCNRSNHDHTC